MTDAPDHGTDTVWVEHVALIDRIPRWLAMLGLAAVVLLIWDLATARTGWVSPIILPSPKETLDELVMVGTNLLDNDEPVLVYPQYDATLQQPRVLGVGVKVYF